MSETGRTRRRSRPGHRSRPPAKPRPIVKASLAVIGLVLTAAITFQAIQQLGVATPTPAGQLGEAWSVLSQPAAERDYAKAERLAKSALERQPLQSGAASLLAVIAEQRGDKPSAARLMRAAANLSRRDNIADYWLFDHEIKAGAFDQAALHADALLRRDFLSVESYIYPRLLAGFSNPAFGKAVAQRLAKRPEWRPRFLSFANAKLPNPGAPFIIFSAMQAAGSRPTAEELEPYYRRLIAAGQYEEAYLSWVLFLPQETVSRLENVYDGDFEGWVETPPFGWNFDAGVRGSIESSEPYGRAGMALRVEYDGLTLPKMPSQILILPPGRYRLTGLVMTTSAESAGRMAWAVNCAAGQALLPVVPVPDTKGSWARFSQDLSVPEGCKGQTLTLTPLPGGQRANIEIWFDQLSIDRTPADS